MSQGVEPEKENSLAHSGGEERESQSEEQVQVAGFI